MPKSQGGSDDDDNLQAICAPCHKTKTGTEKAGQ
ncbi:HNH endonuclease [Paraburkholderia xenovorans]